MIDAATSIRDARRQAGLCQDELARRAGTSQSAIALYESGRRVPSAATLDRILRATGGEPMITIARVPSDAVEHGRVLADLLCLADQLPQRHVRHLPRLGFAARR